MEKKACPAVSRQTLARMPYYLEQLYKMRDDGIRQVSAPMIARALSLSDVQVRKDLALVSSQRGKPKSGYALSELIHDIEAFLGYHGSKKAVIVGVGHLGKALLSFIGFAGYGISIEAGFDRDGALIGTEVAGRRIYSVSELADYCIREGISIGIITVPAADAQSVCTTLTGAGVTAIWNFAPTWLKAPEGVLLQNENMAASLALLCRHQDEDKSEVAET